MKCLAGKKCCYSLVFLFLLFSLVPLVYGRDDSQEESFGEMDEEEPSGGVMEDEEEEEDSGGKIGKMEIIDYKTPILDEEMRHFFESFDDELGFARNWIKSGTTKADSEDIKFDGLWGLIHSHHNIKGDTALQMQSAARHHAIGVKLDRPFDFKKESKLILQYEVQFRNGQECGGAYIKLLASPSGDLTKLHDKTKYSIMFGPDKCGNEHKLHFIFMHRNPKNGSLREIHWKKASTVSKMEDIVRDKKWHLLRLELDERNGFEIQIDQKSVGRGNLLEDFSPPVNPAKEIDDPEDRKPEDWDEREKIPDPEAKKPEDWDESEPRKIPDPDAKKPEDWMEDEPENVPDPDATKPSDWDTDMDGEWEPALISNPKCASASGCGEWKAPTIENPRYKGKWKPPMINNPDYKGKWTPRKIPNPDYFNDPNPYKSLLPIDSLAFELWTISDGIAFDNVLLTNEPSTADTLASATYAIKKEVSDAETDSWYMKLIRYTNKNPWMWAVYLLVFAVPLVLFIGYCCVTPGSRRREGGAMKKEEEEEQKQEEEERFISGDEPNPLLNEGEEESGGEAEVEEEGVQTRQRRTRARKE